MTVRGESAARRRIQFGDSKSIEVVLSWHGLTDIGLRREINEDSFVTLPPIFAVADGMGGHTAGEVASGAVISRLSKLAEAPTISREQLEQALEAAVQDIMSNVGETELGTGTTLTGVILGCESDELSWTVFNIGDSRVYQLYRDELSQLTVDHSIVQHLIDMGQISEEEAEAHPHANVITRAVGLTEDPIPDYSRVPLRTGQRILICSDGLTKELTELGIQHYLQQAETTEQAASLLVEQALGNAGRDNVTVIVIDVISVEDKRDTIEVPRLSE